MVRQKGIAAGLISGPISPATIERAAQAGFRLVCQGNLEKVPILEEIRTQSGLDSSQIAYIWDDFADVVVMHRVGLAITTRNAAPQVKDEADLVTGSAGGFGAVREAVELILKAQGLWAEMLQEFEISSEHGRRGRPTFTTNKS